jgi:cyclopropane fatty-acyl-phospholipid synthase-like methyltransferase
LDVTGIDQSASMLGVARAKHPSVPTRKLALRELASVSQWSFAFDGLTCLDALENVGPEQWPAVLTGFHHVLKSTGYAYVTVEIPDIAETGDLAGHITNDGAVLVDGKFYDGVSYHYYPSHEQVRTWLDSGGASAP